MAKKQEYNGINSISSPQEIKKYSKDELNQLCSDIRSKIIECTSTNGGHLSSNLGAVELTVALHRSFDFPKDKLIFDVGHQSYTHKILTGRDLEKLNKVDGISGFQNIDESEYDCYEAGHAGTALSAAEGFAIARDKNGDDYNVIAVVGDASIVTGLSFEAMNDIACRNSKVIVVLNDNDMAISKPVGGLGNFFRRISSSKFYNDFKSKVNRHLTRTKLGSKIERGASKFKNSVKRKLVPVTMFDNMGFTYIGPVDGHDIKALEKAFDRARNPSRSVVIHVITKKGKGYEPAENDISGYWHGVTPFEIETGKPLNHHDGLVSWSHYMGDLVYETLKNRDDVELICPAMIKGSGLDDCFEDFPKKCIDVGIAEEHAMTLSGAMSLNGIHPIVVIYSTFLQRAYDEVLHDCARMGVDMTILIDRAGFVGSNGETHQGIYDAAFLKTIPGVTITMPSNWSEARALLNMSLEKGRGVFAIRYPRCLDKIDGSEEIADISYGKWIVKNKKDSSEMALIAVGQLGYELWHSILKERDDVTYLNPVFLNPIDEEALSTLLKTKKIVIYDPYSTKEGLGESILSYLSLHEYKGEVKLHSAPTEYIKFDSQHDQLEHHGLLPEQILKDFD